MTDFLGALGAKEIVFSDITEDTIGGTVLYDPADPEERQDFCWHASETAVPPEPVRRLAGFIHQHSLLDIDRLSLSREDLFHAYNRNAVSPLSRAEFECALNALEEVEVRMVDDGEETDSYFIHE